MSTTSTQELLSLSKGKLILEARKIHRTLSDDLVLYWSTVKDPYSFIMACTAIEYEPALVRRIEIVADDDVIKFRDEEQFRAALQDRGFVRFNFADWSVIWVGPATPGETAEIQAVVGKLPTAMADMIKKSINGFTSDDVDNFLDQLTTALAA